MNQLPRCKHTQYGDLKRLRLRSELRGNLFDYKDYLLCFNTISQSLSHTQ